MNLGVWYFTRDVKLARNYLSLQVVGVIVFLGINVNQQMQVRTGLLPVLSFFETDSVYLEKNQGHWFLGNELPCNAYSKPNCMGLELGNTVCTCLADRPNWLWNSPPMMLR